MPTIRFAVTALPFSCADTGGFHVSLFIAPKLTPDAGNTEQPLGAFAHFADWADLLVGDGVFELSDQAGVIPCTPLLSAVEPSLWWAVFPPETPVRAPSLPDWKLRHWRTFRAGYLHDSAKQLHAAALFADPTSPPAPSRHPLTPVLPSLLAQLDIAITSDQPYDESTVTSRLDGHVAERGSQAVEPLEVIEQRIDATADPLLRLSLELHRARRFYERPESAIPYRDRPLPGEVPQRPPRPVPDFHERCAMVGDHPPLLRRLGLVVDLRVETPSRLRGSEWLQAVVVTAGDTSACRPTRTRCQSVGEDLVTVPDTPDWNHGRLRLGAPDLFQLLDLEADGSALKLDRFMWTMPRLLAIEENGDPIHAAPTALRSVGFTVARDRRAQATRSRQDRQQVIDNALTAGNPPLLSTEDVMRGMRVEVWDDTARRWDTLHARLIDVEVAGHGTAFSALPETGFIQGTTATEEGTPDSPVHVHEAAFGWSGWSLSAPRPGLRVRHDPTSTYPGQEVVEPTVADPDPVTPVVITTQVQPGTLPRLRYGRSYAFRAWGVDLAGNSRLHALGPASGPDAQVQAAVASLLSRPRPASPVADLLPALRAATMASLAQAAAEEPAAPAPVQLLDPEVAGVAVERLWQRRSGRLIPVVDAGRSAVVARAFSALLGNPAVPLFDDTPVLEAGRIASMLPAESLGASPGPAVAAELDAVTPLRLFLRWDPVQPPAVVARNRFTAGESLRHVVIRSGVTQDLATLAITVIPPPEYAAAHPGLHFRETSERHVAAPKTSQLEAELLGMFDEAIGSSDPVVHRRLAAVALRESGTFFDLSVPRLDDPSVRDPQDGIALVQDADALPDQPKSLPLAPGEAPAPGQYVVHDTSDLNLPYLPDPLARGISLVFPEAGRDRQIGFPFGVEGLTVRYEGTWPALRPFRLVVDGGAQLAGEVNGAVVRLTLPPGDMQRFRLASSFDRADLELFGIWRGLPDALRSNDDVAAAATAGWMWAFTPFEDITVLHAVPRPLEAPRPIGFGCPSRSPGSVDALLRGAVDVHGPSTDSLTLEAHWIDPVDDLTLPVPEDREQRGVAFTTRVQPAEDLALLGPADFPFDIPGLGRVWQHQAVHRLGDTRHRDIRYRFRATTRFREYFDAEALASVSPGEPPPDDPDRPVDDGRSVVGPLTTVTVPSSAPPAAPIVHSVIPLFRWDEATEPEQPVAIRRRRRTGARIYLERPWYSSGAGELLGVLVASGGFDTGEQSWVSQWGADPTWISAPVGTRAMGLELSDILHNTGLDDRPGDAIPDVPSRVLPLGTVPGQPEVTVLGYRPAFRPERNLWYVDVGINPGSTFWPFVRFAVARYQPDSIDLCHLSVPVLCDFVQLPPERTASVARTDLRHVRVVVSGPVGLRAAPSFPTPGVGAAADALGDFARRVAENRTVLAHLQRRYPTVPTDLGWLMVASTELPVRGHGANDDEAAWGGTLEAPEDLPLRRPGENPEWRVLIEEWERLDGDPASLAPGSSTAPVPEQRLIYADEIPL